MHLYPTTEHRFRRRLVYWIPEQVGEDSEGMWPVFTGRYLPECQQRQMNLYTTADHRFRRLLVCWIPEQVGEDSEGMWKSCG